MIRLQTLVLIMLVSTCAYCLNLPDLNVQPTVKPISKVLWTNSTLGTDGKAFRDVLMEKVVQKFFETFVKKVKNPHLDGEQVLQDPMKVKGGINVKKSGSAYDIHLKAEDMKASGLGNLKINYLSVIRRFGLKDFRVNVTISTDLKLDGTYDLQGKAISVIPVTGSGHFTIEIKNLKFYAHTFLSFSKNIDQLSLKDLDIEVRYDDIHFEFQNLMGGGIVGSTINVIINVLGEEIVKTQKGHLIDILKNAFHDILTKYLL